MPESQLNYNQSYFIGKAWVYDKEIFINTLTGDGYDDVLVQMSEYIERQVRKLKLSGFDHNDVRQLLISFLFDGIRRFSLSYGIKLSTFLDVHIRNKIVSRIKTDTAQSLNATLDKQIFRIICECGNIINAYKKDIEKIVCESCNKKLNKNCKIYHKKILPASLDTLLISESTQLEKHNSFFNTTDEIERINKKLDFDKLLSGEDEITRKIAELLYDDYDIKEAAQEVGITGWQATLKLRKLRNKKRFVEYFIEC